MEEVLRALCRFMSNGEGEPKRMRKNRTTGEIKILPASLGSMSTK